jgi:hypothetical protein
VPDDRLAEGGAVAGLVAHPLARAVDQDAGEQGRRRAEEPPDGYPVQERGRAAGLRAEADAAAVVAGGGQGQAATGVRGVGAHHRPVGGKTAGRQDHAARGPDPERARVAPLQPRDRPVQDPAGLGHVQVRPDRPAVQDAVS